MEEIKRTLAHNLRTYRKLAHLSQEKLGEICGLHRTYIGGIEQLKINVSLNNMSKIASALNINPVFLFFEPSFGEELLKRKEEETPSRNSNNVVPGGYALCTWEGESIQLEPLEVDDPKLAVSILVSLMNQGHSDDLAQTYNAVQQHIKKLIEEGKLEAL